MVQGVRSDLHLFFEHLIKRERGLDSVTMQKTKGNKYLVVTTGAEPVKVMDCSSNQTLAKCVIWPVCLRQQEIQKKKKSQEWAYVTAQLALVV